MREQQCSAEFLTISIRSSLTARVGDTATCQMCLQLIDMRHTLARGRWTDASALKVRLSQDLVLLASGEPKPQRLRETSFKKSGALGGVRFLSRWWLGALFLSWLWSVPRTVSQIGGFVLSGFMSLKATPFTNRTRARRQRCVQASVSMCARRAPGVRAVPPGLQTRCLGWTARRRRRKFWGFQVVSNSFLPAWRGLGPIS